MPVNDVVQRHIQEYRKNLIVKETKAEWVDADHRYQIAQRIQRAMPMGACHYCIVDHDYPVLWIPQASEIDPRWIRTLEGNRFEGRRHLAHDFREEDQAHRKIMENLAEDRADELHYYFKKQFAGYRFPNVKSHNRADDVRRFQDRHGRDLK